MIKDLFHNIIAKFKISTFFLLSIFLMVLPEIGMSQKKDRFDGILTLSENITGIASYNFKAVKSDTVFHGGFEFKSIPVTTTDGLIKSYWLNGDFENGKKTGDWLYHTKSLTPKTNIEIQDFLLTNKTSGLDYLNRISFVEGKASGQWIVAQRLIADSKIADTTLLILTSVLKGVYKGNFQVESNQLTISGNINDSGYLDDVWKITAMHNNNQFEDIRIYQNGSLKSHRIIFNQDTTEVLHFELHHKNPVEESKPINEAYFELLKYVFNLKEKTAKIELIEKIELSNQLMLKSFHDISHFEDASVWSLVAGSEPVGLPKAIVYRYPYSVMEKTIHKQAEQSILEITELIDQFLNNPQVKINRFSSEEIAIDQEIMLIFKEQTLLISDAFSNFNNPAFEYINRQDYLKILLPHFNYPKEVLVNLNGKSFSKTYNFPIFNSDEEEFILALNNHLQNIKDDVKNVQSKGLKTLGIVKNLNLLEEKEAAAVVLKDTVLSRFNNQSNREDFNSYHEQLVASVTRLSDEMFTIYANATEETQLEMINELISCHEQMRFGYTLLGELPLKLKSLDELYIRSVWNPYTFTYMDERVKERLYKLFESELLPYLIENAGQSLSCSEVNERLNEIFKLVDTMFSIRLKDTRELEKQLRKSMGVRESLEILSREIN